jgi:hypothetical protein
MPDVGELFALRIAKGAGMTGATLSRYDATA